MYWPSSLKSQPAALAISVIIKPNYTVEPLDTFVHSTSLDCLDK